MTAIADLEIFAKVARTGNMSAAAREMGLSPAVVSKRISLLEEKLGARLFQRSTRQLVLTDIGSGFFKRVIDILSLVEEAEDFVGRGKDAPRGVLKIAAPTYFSRRYLTRSIPKFHAENPEIRFEIVATDGDVDVIKEGFDLAIKLGKPVDSSLQTRMITSYPAVLCASFEYIKSHGMPENLKELETRHAFIGLGTYDEIRVKSESGTHSVKTNAVIKSNSEDLVRDAVLSGMGIAMLPLFDIADRVYTYEEIVRDKQQRVNRLPEDPLVAILPQYRSSADRSLYLIYPEKEFMPAKMSKFIGFFRQTYENHVEWAEAYRRLFKSKTHNKTPIEI